MNPNSTSTAHQKRSDGDNTHVTIGDGSLNYGTIGASGEGGAVHHLYATCHEGSCDRSAYSVEATLVSPTSAGKGKLVLLADGQYNGWDERNAFVNAAVAAASPGEKCETKSWIHGGYMSGTESGSEKQCTQTNFISINRFGSDGSLKGFMSVQISPDKADNGWCGQITGVLGAIASAVGVIPGAEVGGGTAAAFFGLVGALCQ
ncbi:MAG: hypothetical protein Q9221_006628 [Calogaya cf. arnoldii]